MSAVAPSLRTMFRTERNGRPVRFLVVALLVGVVSMQTACRDVCEKRYRVIDRECGFEPAKLDEEPACEGEVEALAQCVVDHPEAFCDYLEDLQLDNAYTGCARRAMGGAE